MMVRKSSNKEFLNRLTKLQDMLNKNSSFVVLVDIKNWLESDEEETFIEYCKRLTKNKSETVIVDDLILQTDMYLQLDCILVQNRAFVKDLIQLSSVSEVNFMKKYIDAFEDLYVVKGSGNRTPILQKAMLENASDFVKDFYEHYKILPIDELVERYKDQKFFRMVESHK